MRPPCRPAALACALLLAGALSGCGDDEAGVGTAEPTETETVQEVEVVETETVQETEVARPDDEGDADSVEAFCQQLEVAEAQLEVLEPEGAADVPEAIRELGETYGSLPRPDEVADDLDTLVQGFRALADRTEEARDLAGVDLSEFDAVQEASDRLDAFVTANC